MSRISALLTAAALVGLSLCVRAADPNQACFECHADKSMAGTKRPSKTPGLATAIDREAMTLEVTAASLKGSVHEGLGCRNCHSDIKELPHDKVAPVYCGSCHDGEAKDLSLSIHKPEGKVASLVPGCIDCHGAHQIKPPRGGEGASKTGVSDTCGACHGNARLMREAGVKIADPYRSFLKSKHYKVLIEGRMRAADCAECHGAHKVLPSTSPDSTVAKQNIPTTCGKCHESEKKAYGTSIHGTALASGVLESPSCADCHGEHDIEAPDSPTSTVYAANIGKNTCPQCHASVRLANRYNLPTGMVKSYEASFHGLASKSGSTDVANCASCHGVHTILPSSDPRSTINPANLAATCGKCHPGAGETFAKTPIHLDLRTKDNAILYWLRTCYIALIALTLGGMALHNGLDFGKRYAEAMRRLKPMGEFIRMTLAERMQHWVLLGTFFTLVITGFALKWPDSPWAWPFRFIPGGFEWRGWLHRGAAVLMIADSAYHIGYLAFTKRGRRFVVDILPTWQDVNDFREQVMYYLGLRDHGAYFGRFTYAEKAEYLALVWGTVVMAGTGFVLWFKTWFTQFLPTWGYTASEMVHFYEAILAFMSILIWHLYAVFNHTEQPPFNPTWLTGRMTRNELEHHHARELRAIDQRCREKEKAEADKAPAEEDPHV